MSILYGISNVYSHAIVQINGTEVDKVLLNYRLKNMKITDYLSFGSADNLATLPSPPPYHRKNSSYVIDIYLQFG